MAYKEYLKTAQARLAEIRESGLYKDERVIASPQAAHITLEDGREVINMCANNYLGLANNPDVIKAAHEALDKYGFGCASVRFICGTQTIHKQLEAAISKFLKTEDTILYGACFDANGGLFECLLKEGDAIISDELNHASIIDGVRLCKATRYRYKNNNMEDLEAKLKEARAAGAKNIMIFTDGSFSMDGVIADLKGICDLADKYDALVGFDECHSTGCLGATGRGTHEYCGVMDRVDIITGTLGKGISGGSGGFTSGKKEIIELLRQQSRPYLFSNSIAPAIIGGALKALELLEKDPSFVQRIQENTKFWREGLTKAGFNVVPGTHPVTPVMLGDARLAQEYSRRLLAKGIYATGFFYPVVPKGKARIRTQITAGHTRADLEKALAAFIEVKNELAAEGIQ